MVGGEKIFSVSGKGRNPGKKREVSEGTAKLVLEKLVR